MNCRFCKSELTNVFIDLINSPVSNSFLSKEQLEVPEIFYPLKVYSCSKCFLVQIEEYKSSATIFDSKYVYFSSYSTSWLEHARLYVEQMINLFDINSSSRVIELASNDGYLLQYFLKHNIPVIGIEPTANTAQVAMRKGIDTIVDFFGVRLAQDLARQDKKADLLLGNNVLAHVPDIVDFVGGAKILLKSGGVVTMEFPHLMQMVDNNQFDTIYHEHFSYLSLYTVQQIFASQDLTLFDVEELPTHGGSLRIFGKHSEDGSKPVTEKFAKLLEKENKKGMQTEEYYRGFREKALAVKFDFVQFLIEQKRAGKRVAAYGAAAKGNTLLNYCGVKSDLIEFVVDANPHKQGKWLPGSHIPVVDEGRLLAERPDYVLILPWNIQTEIMEQLDYIRSWQASFVIPIPKLKIV